MEETFAARYAGFLRFAEINFCRLLIFRDLAGIHLKGIKVCKINDCGIKECVTNVCEFAYDSLT